MLNSRCNGGRASPKPGLGPACNKQVKQSQANSEPYLPLFQQAPKGWVGRRNAPTILNSLYNKTQSWDGRAKTLEDQAAFPIVNPVEMGQPSLDAAVAAISKIEGYKKAFLAAFGRGPNSNDLVRALASYERTLVSFDSPFDHFIAGDKTAISASAKRGWETFNTRGRCNKCHALTETKRDVTTFTDNDFHNIGIGVIRHNVVALACQAEKLMASRDRHLVDGAAIGSDMAALGRFLITRKEADLASFKTPDLRNVLVTAPYFHDGSQQTLWDVLDHYNKGDGIHNPYVDEDIQPLALTEADIDDVVAFLASLTSADYRALADKELERQRALSRTIVPSATSSARSGRKYRSLNLSAIATACPKLSADPALVFAVNPAHSPSMNTAFRLGFSVAWSAAGAYAAQLCYRVLAFKWLPDSYALVCTRICRP